MGGAVFGGGGRGSFFVGDVGVYFLFEAVEFFVEIFFGDLIFGFGSEFGGGLDGITFGWGFRLALTASAHGKDKRADDSESNNYS